MLYILQKQNPYPAVSKLFTSLNTKDQKQKDKNENEEGKVLLEHLQGLFTNILFFSFAKWPHCVNKSYSINLCSSKLNRAYGTKGITHTIDTTTLLFV